MLSGTRLRKTADHLGISVATVFRWRHRILAGLRERTDMVLTLSGIVEADETMFRRSFKGSHIKNPDAPDEQSEAFKSRFGRYAHKRGKEIHSEAAAGNRSRFWFFVIELQEQFPW